MWFSLGPPLSRVVDPSGYDTCPFHSTQVWAMLYIYIYCILTIAFKTNFADASSIPLIGVWWIAHETDSHNETLESTYQICWSAAPGCQSNCFPIRQHSVAAAPGWRPYEPLLSWRRTPPVFEEDICSGQTIDSLQLSETIESFLDFMFEPGRLSWFAIWSTLKVW